jgi:hypothetical protein
MHSEKESLDVRYIVICFIHWSRSPDVEGLGAGHRVWPSWGDGGGCRDRWLLGLGGSRGCVGGGVGCGVGGGGGAGGVRGYDGVGGVEWVGFGCVVGGCVDVGSGAGCAVRSGWRG